METAIRMISTNIPLEFITKHLIPRRFRQVIKANEKIIKY